MVLANHLTLYKVVKENLEHLKGNLNWMSQSSMSMFVAVKLYMFLSLCMDFLSLPKNLVIQCTWSKDEVVSR